MDNFFTWEYLLTFAGCVVGTGVLTQFAKPVMPKIPAQWISFIFALIIMTIGQLATHSFTSWDMIILNIINAVVVSLASNGGYDAIKDIFGKKTDAETELKYEGDDE